MAVMVGSKGGNVTETNKNFRVVFWQQTDDGLVGIPTANCSSLLADMNHDESSIEFIKHETGSGEQWVCPDTTHLDLLNRKNFVTAVVFQCQMAQYFFDYSSTAYGDLECNNYDVTQQSIDEDDYKVTSAQISQHFNQETYEESGNLDFLYQNVEQYSIASDK